MARKQGSSSGVRSASTKVAPSPATNGPAGVHGSHPEAAASAEVAAGGTADGTAVGRGLPSGSGHLPKLPNRLSTPPKAPGANPAPVEHTHSHSVTVPFRESELSVTSSTGGLMDTKGTDTRKKRRKRRKPGAVSHSIGAEPFSPSLESSRNQEPTVDGGRESDVNSEDLDWKLGIPLLSEEAAQVFQEESFGLPTAGLKADSVKDAARDSNCNTQATSTTHVPPDLKAATPPSISESNSRPYFETQNAASHTSYPIQMADNISLETNSQTVKAPQSSVGERVEPALSSKKNKRQRSKLSTDPQSENLPLLATIPPSNTTELTSFPSPPSPPSPSHSSSTDATLAAADSASWSGSAGSGADTAKPDDGPQHGREEDVGRTTFAGASISAHSAVSTIAPLSPVADSIQGDSAHTQFKDATLPESRIDIPEAVTAETSPPVVTNPPESPPQTSEDAQITRETADNPAMESEEDAEVTGGTSTEKRKKRKHKKKKVVDLSPDGNGKDGDAAQTGTETGKDTKGEVGVTNGLVNGANTLSVASASTGSSPASDRRPRRRIVNGRLQTVPVQPNAEPNSGPSLTPDKARDIMEYNNKLFISHYLRHLQPLRRAGLGVVGLGSGGDGKLSEEMEGKKSRKELEEEYYKKIGVEPEPTKHKLRYDSYQTKGEFFVTIYMKGLKEEQVDCKFEERKLRVTFPGVLFQQDSIHSLDLTLAEAIVPSQSKVTVQPKTILIALKKARSADWESLEKREKDKDRGEQSGHGKGGKKAVAEAEKSRKDDFDVEEAVKKIEGVTMLEKEGKKKLPKTANVMSVTEFGAPTPGNHLAQPSSHMNADSDHLIATTSNVDPVVQTSIGDLESQTAPSSASLEPSKASRTPHPSSPASLQRKSDTPLSDQPSRQPTFKVSMPGAWPDSSSSGTSRSTSDHGRHDDDVEPPFTDTDRSVLSPVGSQDAEVLEDSIVVAEKHTMREKAYEASSLGGIASLFGSAIGSVVGGRKDGMPRGLYNMGQTCYVNSIVQALSSTPELRDYFLGAWASDVWKHDINASNPLGNSGKVVQSFAALVRQLNSSSSPVTPQTFINTLERTWALFEDVFQQHDAQEVMAFLLDAIHEDLNERGGKMKGQIKEMADYDGSIADSIVSREFWNHHKLLNSSIIVENFQGLYKSSVTCKVCGKSSMKFDPFMFLTVPLPEERLQFNVYVVDLEGRRRLRKRMFVRKEGRVLEIKEKVKELMAKSAMVNGASKRVKVEREWLITESDPNGNVIQKTFDKSQRVRALADLRELVAYEIEHGPHNSYVVTQHHGPEGPNSHMIEVFGTPLILSFLAGEYTQGEIYRAIVGKLIDHNVLPRDFDTKTFPPPFVVRKVETGTATRSLESSPSSSDDESSSGPDRRRLEEEQVSGNGPKRIVLHVKRFLRLSLDWRWEGRSRFYREKQDQFFAPIPETDSEDSDSEGAPVRTNGFHVGPPSYQQSSRQRGVPPVPTLLDCIDLFTSEEELTGAEAVDCARCGKKTNAVKRMTLYGLPKILIIHLKRFRWDVLPNGMSFSRKIETMIDFPIEADFIGLAPELMGEGTTSRYRLFAVVNHFGNNHSGHYTAFCERSPEGSSERRWFEFDDDAVKEVEEEAVKAVQRPAKGQILVKNAFAGVNFIDTYQRSGLYSVPLPFVLGREGSGTVVAVGEESGFKVGDRVAYFSGSSYAEYTTVPAGFAITLPAGITDEIGGASLLQGLTAWTQLTQDCPIKKGDTILVWAAAGGTGSLQVQVGKHLGATVIGLCSTSKIDSVKLLGADYVIDYTKEDVVAKVKEITKGDGVDAVFDGVGKTTFDQSLACLKTPGGWLITFGNASGPVDPVPLSKLAAGNFRLMRPTLFNRLKTAEQFQKLATELFGLIAQGKLTIKIHKHYPLKDAAQAHTDLQSGKTSGKLLIAM
ncbi:NADPH:quinone reductase [Gonapodya sp. JEL0774]|nr:NADPH:quinone reductase [Gonapodya sp. JEL0774]